MNGRKGRFLSLFLALLITTSLALPAGASEGWAIGMNGGELTHFLKEGVSVVKASIVSCKDWGIQDPKSDEFIWVDSGLARQHLTFHIDETLYGKKLTGTMTGTLPGRSALAPGAQVVLRLDEPNEKDRNYNISYMAQQGIDLETSGLGFGSYDVGWAVLLEDERLVYPAFDYFWSSEINDLSSLKALLDGNLKAPYPAEHPNDQLCLTPSIYYYSLDFYSGIYDVYKIGYATMRNLVVRSDSSPVYVAPENNSAVLHTAKKGDILLDCGYSGIDEGEDSPFPGWRRVLLAGDPSNYGYKTTEAFIREEDTTAGESLPYGSYLVTMTSSVYLLDKDGNIDKNHALRKGTVQAICARQDTGETDKEKSQSLILLTYRADQMKHRRYLRPKHANYNATYLPVEKDIVSIGEAVHSGWVLDPLLMPPDWAAYNRD